LGEAEGGFNDRVGDEGFVNGYEEGFETGVGEAGDEDGVLAAKKTVELVGGDEVGFVEDLEDGLARDFELGENLLDLRLLRALLGSW
jgi:hypothetical protein